jgi:hypothetical protein
MENCLVHNQFSNKECSYRFVLENGLVTQEIDCGSASNLEFHSQILLTDWKLTKELEKETLFVDILG